MKRRFLMISLAVSGLGLAALIGGALPREGFWGFVICSFFMGAAGTFFKVPLLAGPVGEAVGVNHWFAWSGLFMAAVGVACYLLTRPYEMSLAKKEKVE